MNRLNLKKWQKILPFNLLVWIILALYLLPIISMVFTAMMSTEQLMDPRSPLYPARQLTFNYQGKDYPLYNVPTGSGIRPMALFQPGAKSSLFIDPQNPGAAPIRWVGGWRSLQGLYEFHISWDNFTVMAKNLPLADMLRNSLLILFLAEIGVLASSIVTAYGFARFKLPGGDLIFYILIATILIPDKVTTIPTYFVYVNLLHWRGTIYPILLPWFFGSAMYIFLLRQNFRSIPIDLEEAAMLDGAGPLQRLFYVILPQSWPVVITVSVLHFFYMWNETRTASLYLSSANPALMPISIGVQVYESRVPIQNIIEASSMVILAIPVLLLFISQRYFMQGIVVTGTEK